MRKLIIFTSTLFLISCAGKQPKCDDLNVQNLLFEILTEERINNLKIYTYNEYIESNERTSKWNVENKFVKNNFTENVDYIFIKDNKKHWYDNTSDIIEGHPKCLVLKDKTNFYAFGEKACRIIKNFRKTDEYRKKIEADLKKIKENALTYSDSVASNTIYKYELNAIRIKQVQDKIKKCDCTAELSLNGNTSQLDYSAQYMEDDNLYVEIKN